MTAWDRVADFPLRVDGHELTQRERETSSGFARKTTVIAVHGGSHTGYGEDVTYEADEHDALSETGLSLPLSGEHTLASASAALDDVDLFPAGAPDRSVFRNYRRWGVESALLDLALKQAGTDLATALDREYDPVRFVVSTKLDDPPTADRVRAWLDLDPSLEFKVDATPDWTPGLVRELRATGAVRIVDLKAQYEGTSVDQPPDPDLYRLLVRELPDAILEDPAIGPGTDSALDGAEDRVSWDAPIHGVSDVEALPFEPRWLNVKPSRFGTVRSVLDSIEHCLDAGIRLYGGGQFELDVGREHIQALASVFYPDGPNDVAPRGYNDPEPSPGLPTSPLSPPDERTGLRWPVDGGG